MTLSAAGAGIITLSSAEAMRAGMVGLGRSLRCRRDGIPNRRGTKLNAYEELGVNVEGAGAECAFARWLGVYWDPPTHLDDGTDVAGCQVKSSTFGDAHLIFDQRNVGPVVLVTGRLPEYVIRGWYPADVAEDRFLRDGVFWIPQGSLYLLDDLKAWIREQQAAA